MCTKIVNRSLWIKALVVPLMLFVFINTSIAQARTVSGRVTDKETGEGLPGVSVVIEGTSEGSISDMDGNYKVAAPDNAV